MKPLIDRAQPRESQDMPTRRELGEATVRDASPLVLIIDDVKDRAAALSRLLEATGFPNVRCTDLTGARALLSTDRLAIVIFGGIEPAAAEDISGVRALIQRRGVPVLDVLDAGEDPLARAAALGAPDDWVFRTAAAVELPARVTRLLRRSDHEAGGAVSPLLDKRFFGLVVHDLRTPLNVLGIALRMIAQGLPPGSADLDEDLRFAEENFREMERMLALLSDYFRLYEADSPATPMRFSPARFLSDLFEGLASKPGMVQLIVSETCPDEVELDPQRAQLALRHALANAVRATGDKGAVVVTARGDAERWIIELAVNEPPPTSVQSFEPRPDRFERLTGTPTERRGMDLAVVARATELMGGTTRLIADKGRGTTLVLDWPRSSPPPTLTGRLSP